MKYRIEGKVRNVRGADGVVRKERAPEVELHTAAGLLRWALNNRVFRHGIGGLRYPQLFDEKWLGSRDGDVGYDYHLIDTVSRYKITSEHLTAMRRARARYAEIVHHYREIDPEWEPDTSVSPTGYAHFADNSTEYYEVSRKYGIKRRRVVVSPAGDACF